MKYGWWEFTKDILFLFVIFTGGSNLDYDSSKIYSLGVVILATAIGISKTVVITTAILKRDLGDMIINSIDNKKLEFLQKAIERDGEAPDFLEATYRHTKETISINKTLETKFVILSNWAVWVMWIMGLFGLFNG